MVHVRFHSVYGSTARYAHELARRLGTTACDFDTPVPHDAQPLVVLSPVHGPSIPAVKFARSVSPREIAIAAVGMTLPSVARSKDCLASMVPASWGRFYLPGSLKYSTMQAGHKATMASIVALVTAKPMKSANDKSMISMFQRDTDWVDFSELDAIQHWVLERQNCV
ncbi:flavodoxin domain-containing protein [Corynebacterium diphtheriae]|uniref:flavodoxin domain-containing protein n=1 Tax=Corynebacterium diphtheriae TaxID=1717 RepID=UPI0024BCF9A4|nr:flavodoxin domain-containing protein [Corynebacterium diphtheriae]